jgi:hypothetical protein
MLDGSNGFKISGSGESDFSGQSASAAGDVNGDGFDDLIVGAQGTGPAANYVVFGKASEFTANLNVSALDGSNGFKLRGIARNDIFRESVSAAGDVNGDGFSDLIIGAQYAYADGFDTGASYVVFGKGVELSVSDAAAVEGNAGVTVLQFTLSLSEAGLIPVTVNMATLNGTALAGSDFIPLVPTTLTFAPGELNKIVTISVLGNTTFESDEAFSLVLSSATGGVIRDGIGVGTIRNDDVPPLVSIADASVLEGHTGTSVLTFVVSLSEASGLPASVNFAAADGTAISGVDYLAPTSGTLAFAPVRRARPSWLTSSGTSQSNRVRRSRCCSRMRRMRRSTWQRRPEQSSTMT